MSRLNPVRLFLAAIVILGVCVEDEKSVHAVAKSWNSASNSTWNTANNWTPPGVPLVGDDVTLGNIIGTEGTRTTMDVNDSMNSLTIINGNDLDTGEFNTFVSTATTITGAGSTLLIKPRATQTFISFDTNTLDLNAGATVLMLGGRLQVDNGVFDLAGTLTGYGNIQLDQSVGANTTLLNMSGTGILNAGYTFDGIGLLTDQAATLQITAADTDARVDFDNGTPNIVNLLPAGTLDLDVMMADTFNDTINLSRKSTFDSSLAWEFAGTMNVNTQAGFLVGQTAGPATLTGQLITMSGGDINLDNTADHLIIDTAAFTATGGIINLTQGKIQFDSTTTIGAGVDFQIGNTNTELIVNSIVNIDDADFNWDGGGGATNLTTINSLGNLDLDLTSFDGNDSYDGGIAMNGGELDVTVADGEWTFGSGDSFDVNGPGTSTLNGSRMQLNGTLNVNAGTFDANADTEFVAGANLVVDAGATAQLDGTQTFLNNTNVTVNGTLTLNGATTWIGPASVLGTGRITQNGNSTVTGDTVISVATYDWDQGNTVINTTGSLTLNVTNIDVGNDTFNNNPITVNDAGTLQVTVADGTWNLGAAGVLTLNDTAAAGTPALLSGSALVVDSGGIINITGAMGDINTATTLNEGAVLNINTVNGVADVNTLLTLNGGDVSGVAGSDLLHSGLTVTGTSAINVTTIDLDGGNVTLAPGGSLDLNVTTIETAGAEVFDLAMNFTGGTINVNNAANEWFMDGAINSNGGGNLFGDRVLIGDDLETLNADVNINSGTLNIGAPVTFNSDADVNVAAGATLNITNANTLFLSNAGGNNAEFTGQGTLRIVGADFAEATTLNMTGGTVALDGALSGNGGLVLLTAGDNDINANLTINAATVEDYGFTTVLPASTSELNISDTATLAINLDNANAEWTVIPTGIINYNGNFSVNTFLTGSDLNMNGTLNVVGDGRVDARLDIGGTVNLTGGGADEGLRLSGGTIGDPNTISGGTISGNANGVLRADNDIALRGNGIINTDITFGGSAELIANGGTLEVNGSITDMGTLRANSGTLQLDTSLASSVTSNGISLDNGTLQGTGLITLDVRNLRGNGTVTSRVTNDNSILAQGGTLNINNALTDLDGTGAEAGILQAQTGNLRLQNFNTADPFGGDANVDAGRTFEVVGRELVFENTGDLNLNGGTFQSNFTHTFDGDLTVNADSQVVMTGAAVWAFDTASQTILNADLETTGDVIVTNGASISGPGSLTNSAGNNNLQLNDGAVVSTVVINEGQINIGVASSDGTATVQDLDLRNSSTYNLDVNGTGLNEFDRLSVNGTALIDGVLDVDFGFAPALGNTFAFMTGLNISGTFDLIDITGLGAGLTAVVDYNVTSAVLRIAAALPGDFDFDGDVDGRDFLIWQRGGSPAPLSAGDLTDWQANYGAPLTAAASAVPEPVSMGLCFGLFTGTCLLVGRRR
ncbi:beta strand repeat-containing protein [Bythopirellula polymerisocia]|uniref:Autotransporter-associated beta strand repeat protein n=1 Tax=Bythopirellula polymerisocia TaxID=2528003 RepID=A0A5C6D2E1_9BACT|nr:hypothetical protein [Bythopirellula polymerisocia]TWU30014.1 hypothetical protein Pla144_08000 [Bythopirellula polymerisocia]